MNKSDLADIADMHARVHREASSRLWSRFAQSSQYGELASVYALDASRLRSEDLREKEARMISQIADRASVQQ